MWLSEKIGKREEVMDFSREITARDLLKVLSQKYPLFKSIANEHKQADIGIIILVNGKSVSRDYVIRDGDRIIVLPPVSGG